MSTTTEKRRFVLVIERWQPTPLNKLLTCHWATANRLKKVDRNMVCAYCISYRIPVATGPREVRLTIVLGPGQRASDPDAYQKSLGDALVHARMLVDDNRQYVRWAPAEFRREEVRGTWIELIDL